MDFINNMSSEDIFNMIKAQYKADTGYSIQIGSDEFAVASVVAYIFGVLIERFNEQAKQRYLSTATGEYLNAIAETYNISRPQPTHATMQVNLLVTMQVTLSTDYRLKYNGLYFRPIEEVTSPNYHTEATWTVVFIGAEENPDVLLENNIPAGEPLEIVTYYIGIFTATTASVSGGASNIYPMTDEGDDAFRDYIRTEMAGVSVAGPARAYERIVKDCDPRILDVYCKRFDDTGFEPGVAKLYILLTADDYTNHWAEISQRATLAAGDENSRPVCDTFEIIHANTTTYTIRLVVKASVKYGANARIKMNRDMTAYKNELNSKLGAVFSISELARRAKTPDSDGTVVDLVVCENDSQSFIQVPKWEGGVFSFVIASYEIV